MLQKTIKIADKDVTFKSSAAIPRLYRIKFGRDIFSDLNKLEKAYKENAGQEASMMEIEDLEIFENVAYIIWRTVPAGSASSSRSAHVRHRTGLPDLL